MFLIGRSFAWWDISNFALNKYTKNPAEVFRNIIWSFGLLFGGVFALLGFANSLHRTQQKDVEIATEKEKSKNERYAKRRQIDSEIFARSVDQLGHEKQAVRLGGLYAIENLAQTAIERQLTQNNRTFLNSLLETLSAYVRGQSPVQDTRIDSTHAFGPLPNKVSTDVEAAIRVISRTFILSLRKKIGAAMVDLRQVHLPRLEMPENSDLQFFDFSGTNLAESKLDNCNFTMSDFSATNLVSSHLFGANFSNADFGDFSTETQVKANSEEIFMMVWHHEEQPMSSDWGDLQESLVEDINQRTQAIVKGKLWEKYLKRKNIHPI